MTKAEYAGLTQISLKTSHAYPDRGHFTHPGALRVMGRSHQPDYARTTHWVARAARNPETRDQWLYLAILLR